MADKARRVVVLGATGSIGASAAKVARTLPGKVELVGLSAHRQSGALIEAAREFHPRAVCFGSENDARAAESSLPPGTRAFFGEEGLIELATMEEADMVLVAIVGTAGLRPALAAVGAGKDLAIASKEILVMAGEVVMGAAARAGVRVLPVDSEHNAIHQCLRGQDALEVGRLILTCSGGPCLDRPAGQFWEVAPGDALRHPTWSMGRKITVDSATLFNKGLEMIEARWLFEIGMERIDVVVHPQSIVHSMVEFIDGSVLAQLSATDMAFPIQYAFTYPERVPGIAKRLDFSVFQKLEFLPPRRGDFPALDLAVRAGKDGGTLPAVLNAANEVAVEAFLAGKIRFPEIWETVERCMNTVVYVGAPSLDQIFAADREAREEALRLVSR